MKEVPFRDIDRRGFIKVAAGVTAVAAARTLLPRSAGAAACTATIPDNRISIQVYTCTAENAISTEATLRVLRQIGYRMVEHAGFGSAGNAKAFGDACRANGIWCTGGHWEAESGLHPFHEATFRKTLVEAKKVGQRYFGLAGKPTGPGTSDTEAGWLKYCADINKAGPIAKSMGFKHLYQHFHTGEWGPASGSRKRIVDILMHNTDPAYFHVQMDIGWAYAGLGSSIANVQRELRRYPMRFWTFHVKDMRAGVPIEPGYGEIGVEGFKTIFGTIKETQQRDIEYIIENDSSVLTCFDAAKTGYDMLHGLQYGYRC